MFPAYFTLVGSCCAISLSAFGYLHPWKSASAVEKYQLGFLLSAFAFNLTNLFVFTPMTIDVSGTQTPFVFPQFLQNALQDYYKPMVFLTLV